MEPQSGWHGYWKQPGSIGLAPQFNWQLPDGVSVGDARFPVPHTLMTGDLMNHVFEYPYALLIPVEIDGSVAPGTPLPITVGLNYLACRADACVPEQSTLAIAPPQVMAVLRKSAKRASMSGGVSYPGHWARKPAL